MTLGATEGPVGDVGPGLSAVFCFPNAAAGAAEKVEIGLAGHAGNRAGTAAAEGADVAEFEGGVEGLVLCLQIEKKATKCQKKQCS